MVSMAVIPKDTRAGIAKRSIQKQHHERTTSVTAGVKTDEKKNSRRRLKENTTVKLAKEPAISILGVNKWKSSKSKIVIVQTPRRTNRFHLAILFLLYHHSYCSRAYRTVYTTTVFWQMTISCVCSCEHCKMFPQVVETPSFSSRSPSQDFS